MISALIGQDEPETLEDRLAQLLFVRVGSNLPPSTTVEEDEDRVAQLLEKVAIGGLCLFNGRWPATRDALCRLQAKSRYPLLVGADLERGAGQQLQGLTVFPHAMAFGQCAPTRTEAFAKATAQQARNSGIHINFAPVADVNSEPRNPIIATRSFGTDPLLASEHVVSFIRGTQEAGVLATAKHFPGHGNTYEDSHDSVPYVSATKEELDRVDLVPFRAAIQAGVQCIMTAHVAYPHLDASRCPATVSHQILSRSLRTDLGFSGLIITDSLLMEGVRRLYNGEAEIALAALRAGADVLLDVADPVATIDGLLQAVDSGQLPIQLIDEAASRVWRMKQQVFAGPPATQPAPSGDDTCIQAAGGIAAQVAREALQWEGDLSLLPFDPGRGICGILVRPFETYLDRREDIWHDALEAVFESADCYTLGPQATEQDFEKAQAAAERAPQLVVGIVVKPAAWHRFGLLRSQVEFVLRLCQRRRLVIACLGTPVALSDFGCATAKVCAFSDVAVSQRAVAESLVQRPPT